MRWAEHVARMWKGEVLTGCGSEARCQDATGKT